MTDTRLLCVGVSPNVLAFNVAWRSDSCTVGVLMESAPAGLNVDEVRDALLEIDGAQEVQDVHVWTITSGIVSLSAHVIAPAATQRAPVLKAHARCCASGSASTT
jgi:cobalt-zinc-cadmium efflux system protein